LDDNPNNVQFPFIWLNESITARELNFEKPTDYQGVILFNALVFGIAAVSAQWRLSRYYRP
jgi:hypothetical protein